MGDETFSGRTALVTGASRGIGRAVALGLASSGADLALLARSRPELDEVAEQGRALGARVVVVPTDLADQSAVTGAIQFVQNECGVIDILINNAAVVQPMGPTVDVDVAEWAAAIAINLLSPVTLTVALLPDMLGQEWGRVVNVTAKAAVAPSQLIGGNAYTSSKAALDAHTLNLAAELADTGVTVNAFRPGIVDTAIHEWVRSQPAERIGAGLRDQFIKFQETGLLISPKQSAAALISRLGGPMSGQIWDVDDDDAPMRRPPLPS